ncbi:MAG: UbiA-like polyprenyltransferase [Desulfobacteraceae bacterium]|jgi:4-hydroxybenzoate polyprenyltransferase
MFKNILNYIKIEHTAFSLPLIFTGAWMGGKDQWPRLSILLLIVLAAVGARIFGMSFNRIFDRRIDALNPRTATRELPAGKMDLLTALTIALAALALYLGACIALGRWCVYLSPLPLIPLTGYSLLKRFTWLCHFGIGLCLALAPLGAYVAAAGHPKFTLEVVLFAGFVFFWLSGADIIYAIMDIESDRKTGIYSIPAKLGAVGAQWASAAVHMGALGCLTALLMASPNTASIIAFVITLGLFVLMYMPFIPVPKRFFPISTLAGVAGAVTPMLL